ncbi:MAG TPA: hypothetical protein VIQ00_05760 [Chitinophagaceae bacterium]|jgi:hypothetical protein
MKNVILILCSLFILSCSKDATGPDNSVSGSGSIEYKVNGNLFKIENVNIQNGESVVFAKQLQGSIIPATRYLLNGQKGVNNFIGFAIVTDSLQSKEYHYDSTLIHTGISKYSFTFDYNGQIAGLFFNGDYFDVNITSYKNGRISGTFNAKFTPLAGAGGGLNYNSRNSIAVTDGKLNDVQVIY